MSLAGNARARGLLELLGDRDQALHQRPALARSARPRLRGCWSASALRVTRPSSTSRVTSRDSVEASMLVISDEIDLALLAVARQHREHPPHRDAQVVRRRARRAVKLSHQREADAIDEVRQIVAEIELRCVRSRDSGFRAVLPADVIAGNISAYTCDAFIAFTTIAIASNIRVELPPERHPRPGGAPWNSAISR